VVPVNQILGTSLSPEEIGAFLKGLELQVEGAEPGLGRVTSPTFRVDLQREIDLVEEVARLHGFDKIPVTLPREGSRPRQDPAIQQTSGRAREILTAGGFWEVITYSFISPQILRKLRLSDGDWRLQPLRIQNPLSEETGVMRPTLLPGLLQTVGLNVKRQIQDLKIFELAGLSSPRRAGASRRDRGFIRPPVRPAGRGILGSAENRGRFLRSERGGGNAPEPIGD